MLNSPALYIFSLHWAHTSAAMAAGAARRAPRGGRRSEEGGRTNEKENNREKHAVSHAAAIFSDKGSIPAETSTQSRGRLHCPCLACSCPSLPLPFGLEPSPFEPDIGLPLQSVTYGDLVGHDDS